MISPDHLVQEGPSYAPRRNTYFWSERNGLPQAIRHKAKPARIGHHNRNDRKAEYHYVPAASRAEIGVSHRVDRFIEDGADDRADQKARPANNGDQRDLDRERETGKKIWIGESYKENVEYAAKPGQRCA